MEYCHTGAETTICPYIYDFVRSIMAVIRIRIIIRAGIDFLVMNGKKKERVDREETQEIVTQR